MCVHICKQKGIIEPVLMKHKDEREKKSEQQQRRQKESRNNHEDHNKLRKGTIKIEFRFIHEEKN